MPEKDKKSLLDDKGQKGRAFREKARKDIEKTFTPEPGGIEDKINNGFSAVVNLFSSSKKKKK